MMLTLVAKLAAALVMIATISISTSTTALAETAPASAATKDVADSKEITKKKWDVNNPPGAPEDRARINLDTKTGTWMTVDVSPDGKQIVFDLLGDLYLLPIAGGEAKPLTSSMAWEMQAKFSPDGKRIAYMSDAGGGDNIWVSNFDGTSISSAREVSKESIRLLNNPVWHPNGQYIAARKHFVGTRSLGSGEIWMFHASGTEKQQDGVQLNEKPNWQKDLGEPAFSPDGRYVYYSQDTTPGTRFEYNKNSNAEIYRVFRQDMRTGKTIPFVTGAGGAIRPVPSPDGKYLAFVKRVRVNNQAESTLFIKDLKTGEETATWGGLERDMQEAWAVHGVYPSFSWMPNAKEIVVWAQGKIWRVDVLKKVAVEIPFHVKDSREIRRAIRFPTTVGADKFAVHQLRSVNVSPDGTRVVYSALGHLYLRNLPTGTPERITKQTDHFEYFPRFSADGKRVVYATWDDEKLGSIRTIEIASKREIIVTADPGQYSEPAFSADGKQIAYVKSRGGYLTSPWYGFEAGVHVTLADGTGASRLITEEGRAPQFGTKEFADSLYVTRQNFTSEVDWTTSLTRIKLDKSEEQQIVRSEMATDFTVSPDGAWLAFRERYNTHVMPLPPTGRAFVIGKKSTALPVKSLSVNAGDYLHFSGDSATVHFALGDELFSRQIKDTFEFAAAATSALPSTTLPKMSERGLNIGFTQASDKPSATTVISGAKIITMKGDEVVSDGRIVVAANRIVAIGSAKDVPIPAGASVIDARGKTIIPGLVDVHWHGGMGVQGIIPKQSWINYASLAFGVTTIHDPSNDTATIFTVAEMQRAGLVVGPRIYSTGTILYGARGTFAAEINSLDDALTHLKRMKAAGANTVKSYNQPRRDQRQQVLEAARQTSMMVVPEGGSLFQHNMNMIIDGHTGIEHAIPVAHAYDDVKQLWSQTAVGYTPTLNVAYGGLDGEHYWYAKTDVWRHPILSKYVPRGILEPRAVRRPLAPDADYNVITVAKTATELQRKGVNVNIGAHGQREGLGSHWDIWMLAKGGMTPLEAIRSATLNGAKYLGMERDIGSLEVGKLADMIIINADVLANIEDTDKITYVMQNGRLYDVATMNEIGATPKARKPFFFERGMANLQSAVGSDAFSRISALGDMVGHDHSQCNH